MPLFVFDKDVLGQIDRNDAQVGELAAIVGALSSGGSFTLPTTWAATVAAWNADVAAWRDWAQGSRSRLSGGFLFGEWVGVPAEGNVAMSWKRKLDGWAAIFNATSKGQPSLIAPETISVGDVSDQNIAGMVKGTTGALDDVGNATKGPLMWLALGLGGFAVLALLVTRRT